MRVCVIFNPAARGGKARYFRRHLGEIGGDCALKPTPGPGAGRILAAEAVGEGFDTVVAAGGDGTLNEVLNGIGDVPDGFKRTRLAVLPLGTANVFARELRLPTRLRPAWEIIQRGRERTIDLGQAEFTNNGRIERRYFVQLAGAGVDARAVEFVDWATKKRSGYLAYFFAGLKAVRETKPQINAAGPAFRATGHQVAVGNGRLYGGPFVVFPRAELSDGLLDVCVIPRVTWGTVLSCAWGLATGTLSRRAGMRHFQTGSFTLTAPQRAPLELDGELAGELPATFTVHRQALRVIVP